MYIIIFPFFSFLVSLIFKRGIRNTKNTRIAPKYKNHIKAPNKGFLSMKYINPVENRTIKKKNKAFDILLLKSTRNVKIGKIRNINFTPIYLIGVSSFGITIAGPLGSPFL
jgi:hypothetical protein